MPNRATVFGRSASLVSTARSTRSDDITGSFGDIAFWEYEGIVN